MIILCVRAFRPLSLSSTPNPTLSSFRSISPYPFRFVRSSLFPGFFLLGLMSLSVLFPRTFCLGPWFLFGPVFLFAPASGYFLPPLPPLTCFRFLHVAVYLCWRMCVCLLPPLQEPVFFGSVRHRHFLSIFTVAAPWAGSVKFSFS